MIGKKTVSETPISNLDAKELLEKVEKDYKAREKEIGYELEQSLKYAKKHSKMSQKEHDEKEAKLAKLKLPKKAIVELLNIKPTHDETVKAILFKKADFNESTVKDILEILK